MSLDGVATQGEFIRDLRIGVAQQQEREDFLLLGGQIGLLDQRPKFVLALRRRGPQKPYPIPTAHHVHRFANLRTIRTLVEEAVGAHEARCRDVLKWLTSQRLGPLVRGQEPSVISSPASL